MRKFGLLGLIAAVQLGAADPRIGSWMISSAVSALDPPNKLSITALHDGVHVVMSGETRLDFSVARCSAALDQCVDHCRAGDASDREGRDALVRGSKIDGQGPCERSGKPWRAVRASPRAGQEPPAHALRTQARAPRLLLLIPVDRGIELGLCFLPQEDRHAHF